MLPLIIYCIGTILDGLLTFYGMTRLGYSEGNPIIRYLMGVMGMVPALVATRIIGMVCAGLLWYLAHPGIVWIMVALVFAAAVAPWSYVIWKAQ